MLTTLRIKNLALVEDLTLELRPGLNIITGETGAGKSILIGALTLVLGERADRTLIRAGAESCSVEAVFETGKLPIDGLLEDNGLEPCEGGQLILKRTLSAAGANRQFVNGSPATLNVLASIGEWLVDIHGPHDHQSLLHPARQLAILDAFGGLDSEGFAAKLRQREELLSEKEALVVDEKTYAQQMDLLRFQVHEINAAKLQPNEEAEVTAEYHRASNAAKLLELGQSAVAALNGNEDSLLDRAGILGRLLQDLQRLDAGTKEFSAAHERVVSELHELQHALSVYVERLDLDPARLEEFETRLNVLQNLKRKYGPDVIAFGDEAARKLRSLEARDTELARLNGELRKVEGAIWRAGKDLSTKRRNLIPPLSKAVVKHLGALGFRQSQFDVSLSSVESLAQVSRSGIDAVEFQFAPNPGEPARPLRAIASSGELARVMLALKTALAAVDAIPVLVFDEVDANVGGETAAAVGEKMLQISENRQVICITHLPQVAAYASAHFMVTKHAKAGRTISELHELKGKQRVQELARMLGGQTEAALKHAEAMLHEGARPTRR